MVEKTGAYGSLALVIVVLIGWIFWDVRFGSMSDANLLTSNSNPNTPLKTPVDLPEISVVDLVRVVDGDTIKVTKDGQEIGIRLIGVDTPETNHPTQGVECYGPEATAFLRQNITRTLRLESDETQDEVDRYGRYLRYVYTDEGILLNQLLIEEGYGNEYTYRSDYLLQEQFMEAEERAQFLDKGLWTSC